MDDNKIMENNHTKKNNINSKENINVSIISSTLLGGGAERIAATLINNLPNRIERSMVVIYDYPSKYHINIKINNLIHLSNYKIIRICSKPIILIRYIQHLSRTNTQISLSMLDYDNLINAIACLITGKQAILSYHGLPSAVTESDLYSQMILRTSLFIINHTKTSAIAVSDSVKNDLVNAYHIPEKKVSVIYNPIDITQVQQLAEQKLIDSRINRSIPKIITVGSLSRIKGQWHLIRIFAILRKTMICQLLICGEGKEHTNLKLLAEELGVDKDIIFLGWHENPYVYIANSDVFVLTSISESFSNVVVESLACGCPVVSSYYSSAVSEVLGDDSSCGIIGKEMSYDHYNSIDDLDECEKSLLEAIQTILCNPSMRDKMSVAGKERAKKFGLDQGIDKYYELFKCQIQYKDK